VARGSDSSGPGAWLRALGFYEAMVAFVLALMLLAASAHACNLLIAGGWPGALALLTGLAAFGANPTDPLRAVAMAAAVFVAASFLRRA
jgi:hypothetical protein